MEYEVHIRSTTPAATVQDLRTQIAKPGPLFPPEDILESLLSPKDDLRGISDLITKTKALLESPLDRNALLRVQNYLHHLYHRYNRIVYDDTRQNMYETCVTEFQTLLNQYNSAEDTAVVDELISPKSNDNPELQSATSSSNINVSSDRGLVADLAKIRFDGKSCVCSFIQCITEFSKARNISSERLLSLST